MWGTPRLKMSDPLENSWLDVGRPAINGLRSCGTFIGIRSGAGWWRSPSSGDGAAFVTMPYDEPRPVRVNDWTVLKMKIRAV